MKDLISVIIPVYNVKEYLHKCVSSVLNQSYSNLEIIIIDDGSTDGSAQLCDSFTDDRIKIIHKENGGLSSARNAGIDISEGKYICFVDSDDYIDVDMVESLYDVCEKYSCEISMCGYHIVNSPNPDYCKLPNNIKIYSGREALEEMLAGNIQSFAWNKMYQRKLFDEIRFPEGKVYEDIYVMHKLFLKSEKICCIPNRAYYYVWRKGSIMHQYSIKNTYDNYMALKSRLTDIQNLELRNIGGLYADLIRIRLYFEITKWKVSKYEKKKYHKLIKKIDTDFKQIKKTGYECYLSQNEKLKYSIFGKSKILYGMIVAGNYDGKRRKVIETLIRKIQRTAFHVHKRKYEHAIWYIGLPEYNNLGDCAIGYCTQKFIHTNYPEYDLFLVTEKQFFSQWGKIKKYIMDTDTIILQGGGNITDLYPDQQAIRKKVLSSFKNNKIVIMPQTVYFTKTSKGKKNMNETYALYRKCKHLLLACRENITFKWVQKNFVGIDAILCPDIVMSLTYTQHFERKGILICVRNDKESSWAMELLPEIKKTCLKLDSDITYTDTVENKSISVDEYEKAIQLKLDDFSQKRLVITDRLHGVIFAAVTGTPCIAIDNFNHKVEGICKWMDKAPNVFYVKSFQEFKRTLEEMKFVYDNSWLDELQQDFEQLKERIGG